MYCMICGHEFNPDTVWDYTCLDCLEDLSNPIEE